MALSNLGTTVSIYFGSFLAIIFGVDDENYSNLKYVLVIKTICRFLPLFLIFTIAPQGRPCDDKNSEDSIHDIDEIYTASSETSGSIELSKTATEKNVV